MPNVIHMTAAQAASVTGKSTTTNAALEPIALTDGTFFVGLEVLAGDAFADRHTLLLSYPQVDYDAVVVPLLPPAVWP